MYLFFHRRTRTGVREISPPFVCRSVLQYVLLLSVRSSIRPSEVVFLQLLLLLSLAWRFVDCVLMIWWHTCCFLSLLLIHYFSCSSGSCWLTCITCPCNSCDINDQGNLTLCRDNDLKMCIWFWIFGCHFFIIINLWPFVIVLTFKPFVRESLFCWYAICLAYVDYLFWLYA